ncbi:MAG: hypothetical protein AB1Z66_13270, partial [Candidatus Limnocylindrales bacterium]
MLLALLVVAVAVLVVVGGFLLFTRGDERAGIAGATSPAPTAVLGRMAEMFLPEDDPPAIIGYGNLGAGELHY